MADSRRNFNIWKEFPVLNAFVATASMTDAGEMKQILPS